MSCLRTLLAVRHFVEAVGGRVVWEGLIDGGHAGRAEGESTVIRCRFSGTRVQGQSPPGRARLSYTFG